MLQIPHFLAFHRNAVTPSYSFDTHLSPIDFGLLNVKPLSKSDMAFIHFHPAQLRAVQFDTSLHPHPHSCLIPKRRHLSQSTMRLTVSSAKRPHDSKPPSSSSSSSSSRFPFDISAEEAIPRSANWSSDFVQLCNEQLTLLMSTMSDIELIALFFRRENEEEGTLEFVPLIVHSSGDDDKPVRIWISSGAASETELERGSASHILPGSVPANWILPDYPFTSVSHHGGIFMPDGGLSVPIEYNDVVAGTIIVRPKNIVSDGEEQWSPSQIRRVATVAKSIALAAALEGKWQAYKGILGATSTLLDSVRSLLKTTLHQIRSPLQALVTFGHLMLRKLPLKDSNRDLAKHVIIEALRVDDLLKPLDKARDAIVLPGSPRSKISLSAKPIQAHSSSKLRVPQDIEDLLRETDDPFESLDDDVLFGTSPATEEDAGPSDDNLNVVWLCDVLFLQAERAGVLCTEKGISLAVDINDNAPPILAIEKFVREAMSNLIDNALKYSPRGAHIGLTNRLSRLDDSFQTYDDELDAPDDMVWCVVWDTGYGFTPDEVERIWDYGFRGSAARITGEKGTGLGLGITRQLVRSCGGEIELLSPLPGLWDPRDDGDSDKEEFPGCAFILSFRRTSDSSDRSPDLNDRDHMGGYFKDDRVDDRELEAVD